MGREQFAVAPLWSPEAQYWNLCPISGDADSRLVPTIHSRTLRILPFHLTPFFIIKPQNTSGDVEARENERGEMGLPREGR